MKRILIVGDSLMAGRPGASFVKALARRGSVERVTAAGRGGATLLEIRRRVLPLIKRHAPDVVILEAGTNDLLLPWLQARGGAWQKLAERLEAAGSVPTTSADAFHSRYSELIESVRPFAPIIVMTIACVGEDVNSGLNQKRKEYNDAICHLTENEGVHLADVGKVFDDILRARGSAAAYLLNEFSYIYLDTLLTAIDPAADFLSRRRGLALTVDGVHLNRQGARIFAEALQDQLRRFPHSSIRS